MFITCVFQVMHVTISIDVETFNTKKRYELLFQVLIIVSGTTVTAKIEPSVFLSTTKLNATAKADLMDLNANSVAQYIAIKKYIKLKIQFCSFCELLFHKISQ